MEKPKKLPLGIQSFETIRENDFLYADKTEIVFKLIEEGMFYFLARPRRFGKSLLVSTLKCLFEGRRELFEGLWIGQRTDFEWKKHPVVILDFNGISHDSPENLQTGLEERMQNIAQTWGIELKSRLLKEKFKTLILSLRKKAGERVVLLVDEYDKPIIDHLGKGKSVLKTAEENRDVLKSFWGVVKDTDTAPDLRFVFFTGVSKFSRVSIFSELNNLDDITMNDWYAGLPGITEEELERYFDAHLEKFAETRNLSREGLVSRLAEEYDGYRFSESERKVYNPYSLLKSLKYMAFEPYWFETGTPTFLANLLKEREYDLAGIDGMEASKSIFSAWDLDNLKPEALLFQTGYLTIKDVRGELFKLGYPNREVKSAFLEFLLLSYISDAQGSEGSRYRKLRGHLEKEDLRSFFQTVSAIFATIPHSLESKRDEAYFHTLFYLMVSASCARVRNEVMSSRGRIDMLVEFRDKIYLLEFKCGRKASEAIAQIREKGYAEPHLDSGKKIVLVGVNFDPETRNIAQWETVTLKREE